MNKSLIMISTALVLLAAAGGFDSATSFVSSHVAPGQSKKPLIKVTNNDFNPKRVSLSGNTVSTGSARISAPASCEDDPSCLKPGDAVFVEIISNTSGGSFSFYPASQNQEIPLILGDETTAEFIVTAFPQAGQTLPKDFEFTIRVADVRRPVSSGGSVSIHKKVELEPPLLGAAKLLRVTD
jgi:hypothetical protein